MYKVEPDPDGIFTYAIYKKKLFGWELIRKTDTVERAEKLIRHLQKPIRYYEDPCRRCTTENCHCGYA